MGFNWTEDAQRGQTFGTAMNVASFFDSVTRVIELPKSVSMAALFFFFSIMNQILNGTFLLENERTSLFRSDR